MKKTISIILSISLIAVLALSMTGCLMVTLRENAILERLAENEYTVMQSNSILPFSDPRMAGLKITKCFSAHKADETVNEQYDNLPSQRFEVGVYFMEDSTSASKLMTALQEVADEYNKAYEDAITALNGGNADLEELPKRYLVYRYNDIVIFGDWQSVSLVRGY